VPPARSAYSRCRCAARWPPARPPARTGWIDPNGTAGGPVTSNSEPGFSWTTYPESLQNAGVSWRVYQETDNYDDNPLAWFTQFRNAATSSPLYTQGMAYVGDVASAIASDIAAGTFPKVSWVVAPAAQSEHPSYAPALGAQFVGNVLSAIAGDQATWDSTVVFLNYDENDGFFDHVAPPTAPSGTADEFVSGKPIGLGPRVPMTVISPWSTGGVVCSEVFDHTSPLQFVEQWLGVQCPNISAWRRQVCGNMLAAFDFSSTVTAFPSLPSTSAIVAQYESETSLPAPTVPSQSPTTLPTVEPGDRAARPLGYVFDTTSWTDTSTNRIWFKTVNNGSLGGGFTAYTVNYRTYAAWQYTCTVGSSISDYFSAYTYGGGPYDIDLHGPDGYLRGFKGNVLTWTSTTKAHPEAYVVDNKDGATMALTLTNSGTVATTFTIGANAAYLASGGSSSTVTVAAGGSYTTTLAATSAGRYDYTVTASVGDGFARRFAGRLYNQA
jgi:phospholipase C